MTHRLPQPDQNQNKIVKKYLKLNNSPSTKARSESESNFQQKYFGLKNPQATQAKSESESNYQETLETEQLTIYQTHIIITIKLSQKHLRLNSQASKVRSESELNC